MHTPAGNFAHAAAKCDSSRINMGNCNGKWEREREREYECERERVREWKTWPTTTGATWRQLQPDDKAQVVAANAQHMPQVCTCVCVGCDLEEPSTGGWISGRHTQPDPERGETITEIENENAKQSHRIALKCVWYRAEDGGEEWGMHNKVTLEGQNIRTGCLSK